MQYPNGYVQANYYDDGRGGYEYGSAPQTQAYPTHHVQHPMVVIPSQTTQHAVNVTHYPPSQQLYHSQPPSLQAQQRQQQPIVHSQSQHSNFYIQYPSQYGASTTQQQQQQQQQQLYRPQSQQHFAPQATHQPQQHSISSHLANTSQPLSYHTAPSQLQYHPSGGFNSPDLYQSDTAPHCVSQQQSQTWYEHNQHAQRQSQSQQPVSFLPSSPDPLQASPQQPNPRVLSMSQRQPKQPLPQPQQRQSQPQPHPSEMNSSREMPSPRVFARTEVPTHRTDVESFQTNDSRPQKRRKSNEGHSIPPPYTSQLFQPTAPPKTTTSSPPPQPDVNYQALLLALADEYIAAAYNMTAFLTTLKSPEASQEQYDSLISTAMGCIESVLAHHRQSNHRTEARLRLRLAMLMVEETENSEEAEQVLSKGIALCERSRLSDLKYAMHHLLIRLTFKTSPKAALKAIDKLVQEVEALRLTHWLCCFRFLRVSLSLQGPFRSETHAALKHLTALSSSAEEQRDVAVQIVAAVFEGIVHLRSGTEDAADLAQRAFASARTHQLSEAMKQMPQIAALLDCLDLCCCLMEFKNDQIDTRLQHLEKNLDIFTRQSGWNKDGFIHLKLAVPAGEELELDTCGIFQKSKDGHATLPFQWVQKGQVYAFGYALSGYARLCKNAESTKAEAFFREALKLCQQVADPAPQSLQNAVQDLAQRHSLSIAIQLNVVFALCARFDWPASLKALRSVEQDIEQNGLEVSGDTTRVILYLKAICSHGLGDLRKALAIYNSPDLAFEVDTKMSSHERDIRLLAAMNNIFISRTLGVEDYVKAENLLAAIEPFAHRHLNRSIKAAYFTIRATWQGPNNAIMKMKQYLQASIDAAKASANNQLLSMVMNIMTGTLFANIVGEQAEKSAKAGVSLARKARHPLWIVVANGMYGDIMERCGKVGDAQNAMKEAEALSAMLPESLMGSL